MKQSIFKFIQYLYSVVYLTIFTLNWNEQFIFIKKMLHRYKHINIYLNVYFSLSKSIIFENEIERISKNADRDEDPKLNLYVKSNLHISVRSPQKQDTSWRLYINVTIRLSLHVIIILLKDVQCLIFVSIHFMWLFGWHLLICQS